MGGAFAALAPHALGAPVLQELLRRSGVSAHAVDAVVLGNALGAGGNPARMLALAAGLPERCAAFTVDTQCCSGLDAVAMACGLLASGQADVVVAGGVEAWSRAPIRMHRPLHPQDEAVAYERPAFAPDPHQDPDLLESAARYALAQGFTRAQQDGYALSSHQRALAGQALLAEEIVVVAGQALDAYPRRIDPSRAARMPALIKALDFPGAGPADCSTSALGVSAKADGAALVLLASERGCQRLQLQAHARWVGGLSLGHSPQTPLLAAQVAAQACMERYAMPLAQALAVVELHDAFAVQGLGFCRDLGLDPQSINRHGGGLARGHPIGASAAVALVRMLADLRRDTAPGSRGLVAVAGAGGIGSAALLERL
jgi:acetyl-CoA C-acetyltransferase